MEWTHVEMVDFCKREDPPVINDGPQVIQELFQTETQNEVNNGTILEVPQDINVGESTNFQE